MAKKIYDIVGIGIGPFNLGLAALCHTIPEMNCLFIEQNDCFNWHPGLLLPNARLQVPFYADLVTLADPSNPFSYLAYLKEKKKMFRFAIQENYFIKRTDYNEYCRWVASQLTCLKFNCRCEYIEYDEQKKYYRIETTTKVLYSRHVVIGVGTVPAIPSFARKLQHSRLFHSSRYLIEKDTILQQDKISIIGSGQSAAEIFYDLMQMYKGDLYWFTRSSRFFPMDYSKLALEMTSPDYIDHFYSLPELSKELTLKKQGSLYKGINHSLISDIYDRLYELESPNIHLHPNCELKEITPDQDQLKLRILHTELKQYFTHSTDAIILATGYKQEWPGFLPFTPKYIHRNYSIDKNNSLFIQNAESHTHSFNAADLGMGPYRNSVILNTILGYEHYPMEKNIAFQTFGLPSQ